MKKEIIKRLKLSKFPEFSEIYSKKFVVRANLNIIEILNVFRFVYRRYRDAQIIDERPDRLWYTDYHLKSDTRIFSVYNRNSLDYLDPICTATVIFDDPDAGLPADNIFPDYLERFRKQQKKLVEFCSLAAKKKMEAKNAYYLVFKALYYYVLYCQFTDVIIVIQPKHAFFYKYILQFDIYDIRSYPRFKNVKAQLAHLDLTKAKEKFRKIYYDLPKEYNLYKLFIEEPLKIYPDLSEIKEKDIKIKEHLTKEQFCSLVRCLKINVD